MDCDTVSNFHLVTVATKSEGYFQNFHESCVRHGMPLTVLGWGETWRGFTWRFSLVMDFLKTLPKTDIVAFIDAYDVVCLRSKEDLIARFKKYQSNLVFISEHQRHQRIPFRWLSKPIFGEPCKGSEINGGFYIGYAGVLLDLLTKVYRIINLPGNRKTRRFKDDQFVWMHVCKHDLSDFFDKHVSFDTAGDIMYVSPVKTFSANECDLGDLRDKDPVFFHCTLNRNMNKVLRYYGYEPRLESKQKSLFERSYDYALLFWEIHWHSVACCLLLCIALCIMIIKKNCRKPITK